jgi:hypothetical protein
MKAAQLMATTAKMLPVMRTLSFSLDDGSLRSKGDPPGERERRFLSTGD